MKGSTTYQAAKNTQKENEEQNKGLFGRNRIMIYHQGEATGIKLNPSKEKGGREERSFPMEKPTALQQKSRKEDTLNRNKFGSVRCISGKVYVDFIYFGERVRESSGLEYTKENAKRVRKQLDRVGLRIQDDSFVFAKTFPLSKKKEFFSNKERQLLGRKTQPSELTCGEELLKWFNSTRKLGKITERTLLTYKGHMDNYFLPFFGEMKLASINRAVIEEFVAWARERKGKDKPLRNCTINNILKTMKLFCGYVSTCHEWGNGFNPFHGFTQLPEDDRRDKIEPFSLEEQRKVIEALPEHWKPFVMVAFTTGLRQGEQLALKAEDIDWEKRLLHIKRAFTLNINGRKVLGKTKNKYSLRTIRLIPVMYEALLRQKKIHDRFQSEYFFCNPDGSEIVISTLRSRIWYPALEKAGIKRRIIRQTRHSFATICLSVGENPLWIAKVMGHSNTNMVINVYSKYVEGAVGVEDGCKLNTFFTNGNQW